MAITRIPESYRPGFARIRDLSSDEVSGLMSVLNSVPLSAGLKKSIAEAGTKVPTLKREDAEAVLSTLYSLYVYRADEDTPLGTFLDQLVSALRASGNEALAISEEERPEFETRMTKLLSVGQAAISSKAGRLKYEFQNTFRDARILTDIRPVFDDPGDAPVGGTITYTLKIEYHEGSDHKEFFVSLDKEDMLKMKRILERAEVKARSLTSVLKLAGICDLAQDEGD